jgi:hypothetical protein
MNQLVDRLGRTGFAALTSLMWALPMAAWAGSADLSPVDKTAYPWIALGIAGAMLAAWVALVARIARMPVTARRRRLELTRMSTAEKRWALACFAFACGILAWLNAAATVDWAPLAAAVGDGKPAPAMLAAGLALVLLGMVAGAAFSWRRWSAAFARRP